MFAIQLNQPMTHYILARIVKNRNAHIVYHVLRAVNFILKNPVKSKRSLARFLKWVPSFIFAKKIVVQTTLVGFVLLKPVYSICFGKCRLFLTNRHFKFQE